MNKVKFVLFVASISLALAFVFSCSSSDDGGGSSGGNGSLSSDSNSGHNHSSNSVAGISSSGGGSSSGNSSLSSSSNGGNKSSSSSSTGISSSSGGSSSGNSSSSFVNDGKECDAIFNPDNKFCYDGNVYNKCGGNTYNPVTQGCISNKTGGSVGEKCGSSLYIQATQGCCGSYVYSQTAEFCYDNRIYPKCDGMTYNPTTHICQNKVATPNKCGNGGYNPVTQFCYDNNIIYNKCNGEIYNPSNQYCGNGTLKNYDDSVTDTRDGKKYNTTEIGSQTWMAENLNYNVNGSRCFGENGLFISQVVDREYELTLSEIQANCKTYGRLYDLAMAMVACPSGWHLPSNAEWNVLMKFVNPSCSDNSSCAGAGTKLKASGGWNSYNGIPTGTDDFGFSALPGGGYDTPTTDVRFSSVGYNGYWWSSSEDTDIVYYRSMSYYNDGIYYSSSDHYASKSYLHSVRCLKD